MQALHVQTSGALMLTVHGIALHHPLLCAHQICKTACRSEWASMQAKSKAKESAAVAYICTHAAFWQPCLSGAGKREYAARCCLSMHAAGELRCTFLGCLQQRRNTSTVLQETVLPHAWLWLVSVSILSYVPCTGMTVRPHRDFAASITSDSNGCTFACMQSPGVREPWRLVPRSCSWQAIPLLHYLGLRSIIRRPESATPLFSGRSTGAVIRRENSGAHLLSHKPLRLQPATDCK